MSTSTITRPGFDLDVEARLGDASELDYESGWFCIETDPHHCPAAGCDFVSAFVTAAHLIVVWPRRDDRAMLEVANDAQRLGRSPRITEYERGFGPCVAYDLWRRIGGPVHGKRERPENVPFRAL